MFERRQHPRIEQSVRVRWQRIAADGAAAGSVVGVGPLIATTTRDLSGGGLCFNSAEAVDVGAPLAIEFEREFGGPPLSALGRVVRCKPQDGAFEIGVELTWIECAVPEQTLGLVPENAWTLL